MPRPPSHPLSPLPLILWLLIQLLALLLPVLHIPLSDQFPRPIEKVAIEEMLAIQLILSSLLLPLLFRTWRTSLILIASTWPFLQLTAVLSSTPAANALQAGLYLSGWMALLAIWANLLRSDRSCLIASVLFTALVLGDALQGYLRVEFALDPTGSRGVSTLFPGVLRGGFSLLHTPTFSLTAWLPLSIALLLSLLTAFLIRHRRPHLCANLSTQN